MARTMPWFIAVYMPVGKPGVSELGSYGATRVVRFQATDEETAEAQATMLRGWKFVSLAREKIAVY